jgi:hypothetical protein
MERDRPIVWAQPAMREKASEGHSQGITMLIPEIQRLALGVQAIAPIELQLFSQLRKFLIALRLPIGSALAFCIWRPWRRGGADYRRTPPASQFA